MKRLPSIVAAVALVSGPAAGNAPFNAVAVSDAELAGTRGGFRTPLGIDVNFSVEITTRIDGEIALRSTLMPGLAPVAVEAPPAPTPTMDTATVQTVPMAMSSADTSPSFPAQMRTPAQGAAIGFDPITGLSVPTMVRQLTPAVNVAIGGVSGSQDDSPVGGADVQALVPLVADAASLESAFGTVRIEPTLRGPQVVLAAPDLEVRHLIGQASTVIANYANDRVIQTATVVHIDLPNIQSLAVGAALSRIDDAPQRN